MSAHLVAAASGDDSGAWDDFVRSRQDATGYQLWNWRSVFERAFGHSCHYLIARRGRSVTGVLPLVEMRSRLFGCALSSLPYVNYAGILAEGPDAARALARHATDLARSRGLSYVLMRHRHRMLPELPARTHKVTMLLALKASARAMWDSLDRKVRNHIRKAEKSHLSVESGGAGLLNDFYAVFSRNMRDLGTPVYGRPLFEAILSQFPGDARLHVVRLGVRPVAAALSYAYGNSVEIPSASSLREYRHLCPNHLLYWRVIEQTVAAGHRVFDFGRSTRHDGAYRFKEQWGASPEQLWWEYSFPGPHELPSNDRQGPAFRPLIEAWKRLPLRLATSVGPRIARSIP